MVMVKKERLLTFLNRMNGQGIESQSGVRRPPEDNCGKPKFPG